MSRRRCARPSLLPPSQRPQESRRLCRAMTSLRSPCAFKAGRFSGQDFAHEGDGTLVCPASKTLRPRRAAPRSRWQSARPRASPRSAIAVAVQSVCSVSGMGKPPRSRVGSASCSIRCGLVPRHCGYAGLESERTPACLYATRATSTHRGEHAASRRSFTPHSGRDPVPRAACPCSPLVGRAVRSQCASFNSWPGHDEAVRHPRTLCRLARFGDGVTSF